MKKEFFLLLAVILWTVNCKDGKHIATAKGNAVAYGLAHCECEKLKAKTPPGDLTRCQHDMARTTRYLKINNEFNSFSAKDHQEITKAGDEAFKKCMATP